MLYSRRGSQEENKVARYTRLETSRFTLEKNTIAVIEIGYESCYKILNIVLKNNNELIYASI